MDDFIRKLTQIFNKGVDYFEPTSNQGDNFWSTSAAKGLGDFQTNIQKTPETVIKTIKPIYNQAMNQPVINAPLPFKIKSPTVGQTLNFGREAIVQPVFRGGAETKMSLTNDQNQYTPKDFGKKQGLAEFLYGNEPLQNWNDPNRPSRQFLRGFGASEDVVSKAAPAMIALGLGLDFFPILPGKKKLAKEAIDLATKAKTVEEFVLGFKGLKTETKAFVNTLIKNKDSAVNSLDDFYNTVKKVRPEAKPAVTATKEIDERLGNLPELRTTGKNRYTNVREIDNRLLKGTSEPLPWEAKPVSLISDIATQRKAEAETLIKNIGNGGIEGLSDDMLEAFQKWVNARRASRIEGLVKNLEFKDLNNKGIKGILEFQAGGNKSGRLKDVKAFFDDKFKELQKAGIDFDYKQDYLPQLWNNTKHEIDQVFPRTLGTRPSFSLHALLKNYDQGINAGLKPKFGTIADLAHWYEQKANKVLADKKFFDYLAKGGFIQPSDEAMQGWQTLDADLFPKLKVVVNGEKYVGVYKAPPELAQVINNYLRDAKWPLLEKIANFTSRAKNITLSFGIPNTAINMHGINIMARHTLFGSGGNPITRIMNSLHYLVTPGAAEKMLERELKTKGVKAVKNGLTLSTEEHKALLNQAEDIATSVNKQWNEWFERGLFNKMIPSLKLSSYDALIKEGMNEKSAAKLVNNVYGGINWEQMGRSKDTQNFLRSIILAPDWAETTVRLGGNIVKSFTPFAKGDTSGRYRIMMATFLGSYVTLNITNKLTSGHFAYENDPGHTFELEIGYTQDGQKRYLRPYGTAADMFRLPYDAARILVQGDLTGITRIFRNRMAIPLGVTLGAATDTDYRGQTIGYRGKTKFGQDMPLEQRAANIGSEMVSFVGMPQFVKQGLTSATGQQGIEQGVTQGLELPFRYSYTGKNVSAKQLKPIAEEKKLQGKELYEFNKSLQGQNKFSDNQMKLIEQGGQDAMYKILAGRTKNVDTDNKVLEKQINVYKDIQANAKLKAGEADVIKMAEETGIPTEYGDVYYYPDPKTGEVEKISMDFDVEAPELIGDEDIDKKLVSKYKSSLTKAQNALIRLYEVGKIDESTLKKEFTRLKAQYDKTLKGKKAKKSPSITISRVSAGKAPAFKIKKGKRPPVVKISPPPIKAYTGKSSNLKDLTKAIKTDYPYPEIQAPKTPGLPGVVRLA